MTTWHHQSNMDHLLRRAAGHLDKARTNTSSHASRMDKLSPVEERKAQYEQRSRDKFPATLKRHQD